MKSLVLLYSNRRTNDDISIRFYNEIKDRKNTYVFGKSFYGTYYGVRKDYVGKIMHVRDYPNVYPVELPLHSYYSEDIIFLFVNSEKYNENPLYYQSLIINYEKE